MSQHHKLNRAGAGRIDLFAHFEEPSKPPKPPKQKKRKKRRTWSSPRPISEGRWGHGD
jgi:hypothetical protein